MSHKDPEVRKAYNRAYNENYYKREGVADRICTRSKGRLIEKRDAVNKVKLESGCVVCGYKKSTEALDFHHIDPTTKLYSVQALAKHYGLNDKLWAEIAKCVVICANCHRELHAGLIALPTEVKIE